VVAQIALVYVLLTLACAVAFSWAGMGTFDALGHAMAAAATVGFSSHDAGLGHFQSPAIEWIATVFMLLGALPFVLHLHLLHGRPGPLWQESQVRLFLLVIATGVLLLALWRLQGGAATAEQAVREAAFNVVSILSTTGFIRHDFHPWGGFASLLLFCAMLMGGCTGSTAGGIKMFRLFVLLEALRAQIRRQIHPSGVFAVRYNRQPVPPAIVASVVTYAFAYLAMFSLLALGLALTGLSFEESLSASAAALGGVGLGQGPRIGPCCTFAVLPDTATWLLTLGMLAGRLEILLLVLPFTRAFWRA
jgi:trk system potassium uptake protein TrkH